MSGEAEENAIQPVQDPLDSQCDDEHLLKVSATVSFNWKLIGRRLVGIKTVQDIDRKEEQCEQEKRDEMFEKWIEMKGSKATYRVLIDVFEEVKNPLAAHAVREIVSRNATSGDLLSVALSPAQDVKTQVDALGVILPSVSPNAKTPDDKLGPPLNFKAQNVTSTSVIITWEPPQNPNGGSLGYEVSYTPKGGSTSVAKLKNYTTCKLIDLNPFTSYYICIRAKTAVGFGEESVPLTISTLEDVPSPPLNLKVQNVTSTSVTVTWEPPQNPNGGSLGYEVSYTPKEGSTSVTKLKNYTTCKLIDLKPFTAYYICVRAKTAVGFGEGSVSLTVSTKENAPSPPLNLRTQDVTSTSVTVNWDPPQNPNGKLQGYEVSYTPCGGCLSSVYARNNTTCELTNLKPYMAYSISVKAKTIAGFGEESIPVIVTTLESVPSPPLILKVQNVTSTSVTVTWNPPQNRNGILQGYEVSYTPKGGSTSFAKLKNDATCKLIDLKPFTVYYICVRARTVVGFGDRSVLLTVSTSEIAPSPPLNLKTKNVTSTTVTVIWDPPQNLNGQLQGYEISYTPNGERPTVVDVQNTTTWKLTDLKPYTSYSISVRAKTGAGFGEKSIPVTISTLESVPSPPNVQTQNVTSTSVTVIWEPPKNPNGRLLGYEVSYAPNGGSVNVQNTTTWKLTDMKPCTTYNIFVRAKTMAGFGEKSIPVTITTLQSERYLDFEPLGVLCLVTSARSKDPDSQQLRMDYITATWKPSTAVGNLGLGTRLALLC
eukprot:Em0610g2a